MSKETWKRVSVTKADAVIYKREEDGALVAIRAANVAWTWKINVISGNVSKPSTENLLDKYVERGFDQHEYVGGFDEATAMLEI